MNPRDILHSVIGGAISRPFATFLLGAALVLSLTVACSPNNTAPSATGPLDLPELTPLVRPIPPVRGTPRDPVDVRIALVGEVRGELEPCGCPTVPYGGFVRRGALLQQLRETGPLFHLDAGDLVMKGFATDRARDLKRRAATSLQLSVDVGVDLWVPGPSDLLALGVDPLVRVAGPKRISATWEDTDGGLLLPSTAVLEKQGIRLGVIGLSAPPTDQHTNTIGSRDPIAATRAGLAALPPDTDLNIAVGNISDEVAIAIAQQVSGIAAILTTRGGRYDAPNAKHGAPIIEVPDRGRFVQMITVRVGTNAGTAIVLSPEDQMWRDRPSLAKESADFIELGRGRNLGFATTIPLGSDLDTSGPVLTHLDAFKQVSLKQAAARAATKPKKADPHYASSGACVTCHSGEFARWSLSGHAKAWRSLLARGQEQNPECTPCHTTAWGEPSGLGTLSRTAIRKFKSVQCESCHGPMGGHPQDARVRPKPIQASTCTGCHDPANSPNFDFSAYLAQASCQGGSPHPTAPIK